ncbi:MAG: ABC transporter ATP-binding protein [Deltaproteobacteria bacterium]|nr:ABC transporter ATP-binding protein [Deltaproteobacteria bacterium]
MLRVKDLQISYGGEIKVVWGVSFHVSGAEIVSMIGSNGAGKTTTIRAVTGLISPLSGKINFLGQAIVGRSSSDIVNLGIVHIPEGRQLFPRMSVLENLILGAYPKKYRIHQRENLELVMGLFPRLKSRLLQKAGSMSGGEQQMVAIGRALMAKPKLLIVDEMSLGLAPVLVKELFSVVERINQQGVAILLVEQNVKRALEIAHRALVMENGRISMSGSAREMLNDEHIRKAYLGL